MGKTNKCNIREDEILAETVKKYKCLYDKSCEGYKEKDRCRNAWKAVEEEIGLEEGKLLLLHFEFMAFKRYQFFILFTG